MHRKASRQVKLNLDFRGLSRLQASAIARGVREMYAFSTSKCYIRGNNNCIKSYITLITLHSLRYTL